MSTVGERLQRYFLATNRERAISTRAGSSEEAQRPLREGEFMMATYPGRYKNEKAAQQAYYQAVTGKSKGTDLIKASKVKRTTIVRGRVRELVGAEEGAWKVLVHYHGMDQAGKVLEQTGAFVALSTEHKDLMASAYLVERLVPAAEQKLKEWCDEYSALITGCTLDYIEVYPINSYVTDPVLFDMSDQYE